MFTLNRDMVYALTLQNPGPFWAKVFTCITHTYYGTPGNGTNQTYEDSNKTNQTYEDSNKTNQTYENYTDYAHANHTSDPIDNTDSWYWMGTALFVIVGCLILVHDQTMKSLVCKFTPEFLHAQRLNVHQRLNSEAADKRAGQATFEVESLRLHGYLQEGEGQVEDARQEIGHLEQREEEFNARCDEKWNWGQQELRALDTQGAAVPAADQARTAPEGPGTKRPKMVKIEARGASNKNVSRVASKYVAEAGAARGKEMAQAGPRERPTVQSWAGAGAASDKGARVAQVCVDTKPLAMLTPSEAKRDLAIRRMNHE
jgi:hypothetical protein